MEKLKVCISNNYRWDYNDMITPLIGGSLELRYFYFPSAFGGQQKKFK